MESKVVLQQRLTLLKQHHDELDRFFQQIQDDVDSAYRNYKGVSIVADVIADLVTLSITAYNSAVLKLSEVSKLAFARQALQFAYRPIKAVLTEISGSQPNIADAERHLSLVPNLLISASNIVGNAMSPSYWASVMANIRSGHWKTAFTRDPAVEIIQIQIKLKRQRAEALEAMERQINQLETELGVPHTFYICKAF
jgi:hypothetical protein